MKRYENGCWFQQSSKDSKAIYQSLLACEISSCVTSGCLLLGSGRHLDASCTGEEMKDAKIAKETAFSCLRRGLHIKKLLAHQPSIHNTEHSLIEMTLLPFWGQFRVASQLQDRHPDLQGKGIKHWQETCFTNIWNVIYSLLCFIFLSQAGLKWSIGDLRTTKCVPNAEPIVNLGFHTTLMRDHQFQWEWQTVKKQY